MNDGTSFIAENARIVLADRVIENGYAVVGSGAIVELGEGRSPERGLDFEGDLLLPGLVELHTDQLEAHYMPRPKVRWDLTAAVISYDAQMATSGITTMLDSLRVWREPGAEDIDGQASDLSDAIDDARRRDLFRVSHFLHLRCEVPMPDVIKDATLLIKRPDVRLLSLMDHTPGQRQFRDPIKLRDYYRGKSGGMNDEELDRLFAQRMEYQTRYAATNYRELVALANAYAVPLASHDDTTLEHVEQSIRDAVRVAEFPTTVEAAARLHDSGVKVLMGAPNLIRGKSHAGNVPTLDLARDGKLDILSSDYVPSSLLMAALRLAHVTDNFDLTAAVRTVSKTPADVVGLSDRGEITCGKRADLIRVHVDDDDAAVRGVWCQGRRVA
jgi:alpha-D-ribose 1-methylphosphonate 5-triphosphate diphosphatase